MAQSTLKTVNNLQIRYEPNAGPGRKWQVWTPDGRCWEGFRTQAGVEKFCRETLDFANGDDDSDYIGGVHVSEWEAHTPDAD